MPKGCHLLQPHHRLQALTTLHQARELLLIELRRLPVILDTLSSQKRKENIEMRLQEVENGITLYERERVVVHDGWEEEAGIFAVEPEAVEVPSAPLVHLADVSLPHLPETAPPSELDQLLQAQQLEAEQQALYRAQYDAIASQTQYDPSLSSSQPMLLVDGLRESNPPAMDSKPRKKNWSAPSPEFLPTAEPLEGRYAPSYDALSTAPSDILGVPLAI